MSFKQGLLRDGCEEVCFIFGHEPDVDQALSKASLRECSCFLDQLSFHSPVKYPLRLARDEPACSCATTSNSHELHRLAPIAALERRSLAASETLGSPGLELRGVSA